MDAPPQPGSNAFHAGPAPAAEPEPNYTLDINPEDLEPRPFTAPRRSRVLLAGGIILAILLLAVVPPLVNVTRFARQISNSIGASLDRPVHMSKVTLNLLPFPGVTLENFVVTEDPAFGSEPVIRANVVQARIRWRSLWHRRVEFSRITLESPSVNLVRLPNGRWNVESILLQASRMPAAPTGQATPGPAPRFPYIHATGARVNLKMGIEKMPIALTDAEFALWLSGPEQWRLRLEAIPARTDTAASDTGTFRLEGTLGKAGRLDQVPVDLAATWRRAPLGAASWIVLGRDAGLRGDMTLTAAIKGTVGDNDLEAALKIDQLRRAEFVPARTLSVDLTCQARATQLFRTLEGLRCLWPAETPGSGLFITSPRMDLRQPGDSQLSATLSGIPASVLLDALRAASPRVDPALTFTGSLDGQMNLSLADPLTALATSAIPPYPCHVHQTRLALGTAAPFLDSEPRSRVRDRMRWISNSIPLALGGEVSRAGQPPVQPRRLDDAPDRPRHADAAAYARAGPAAVWRWPRRPVPEPGPANRA